jgi:SOS response regulatory protein OraA/RecX
VVTHRLLAQGVPEAQVEVALAEAQAELAFDPIEAARAVLARRFKGPLDAKGAARAARLLASRGFDEAVIEAVVPTVDRSGGDD